MRVTGRVAVVVVAAWTVGLACGPSDVPEPPPPPPPDAGTSCTARTCSEAGAACGTIANGCGGTLDCGGCAAGQRCDNNQCVAGDACVPTTCAAQGAQCGSIPDGCGATLQCGACGEGQTCRSNHCETVSSCTPTTCPAAHAQCGEIADGCGRTLQCGSCSAGLVCGGAGTPNQCGAPPDLSCAGDQLGTELPVDRIVENPDRGIESHAAAACGPDLAEVLFSWTAPKSGTFVFDTARSTLDTSLTVRSSCGGTALACNDNGVSYGKASMLTLALSKGQSVVIDLDGFGGRWSHGHLHINEKLSSEAGHCDDDADNDADGKVDCADSDCSGVAACQYSACVGQNVGSATLPLVVDVPSFSRRNDFVGTCSTEPYGPDYSFRFVVPESGDYLVDVASGDDDAAWFAVMLLDACRGRELACHAGSFRAPRFVEHLEAGQSVIVVLDSIYGGQSPFRVLVDHPRQSEVGFCNDRFDNDNDGAADWADSDC